MQLPSSCDQTMDPPSEDFQQVLSIDQIRSIRASNNYVDRPAARSQQGRSHPAVGHKHECSPAPSTCQEPQLSHSSTASSVSQGTAASEQRLLSPSPSGQSLARTPPHSGRSGQSLGRTRARLGDPKAEGSPPKGHALRCEACGRCRCPRCTAARSLPSCWLCNQRCLCSAESLLDYGTCLCCVKGLFYHCSTDDEDTCADEPCSCGPGSCCARWAAMSALSLLLPCLCCYFPTLGCLKLCQRGYDGLKRPGCRCQSHTNTVCRKISSAGGAPFPKTLDKPV